LFFLFLILSNLSGFSQVKFKLDLLPDNITYQVILKPDVDWNTPFNLTNNAQIVLTVPTGGIQVGLIENLHGLWANNNLVTAPEESPDTDYLVFNLQGGTSEITYQIGVEVPLFNFTNTGACTGAMEFLDNDLDPFLPPNSMNINIGNQLSVLGAGPGVNAYTGNFDIGSANCQPPIEGCGIAINNVETQSPSNCGIADGEITISAATSLSLALQYSIDDGNNWQADPHFTDLAGGEFYAIAVRDVAAICIEYYGEVELAAPLAAAVTLFEINDPDCEQSNGSILIEANSENGGTLEFSLDGGANWQSDGHFQNLSAAAYFPQIRNLGNSCLKELGETPLEEDCSQPAECPITYEIEAISSGVFQVSLSSDVSFSFPNNITSTAQVTLKVPTGGFQVSNFTNQLPGVIFTQNSRTDAPPEAPGFDYISVGLSSAGTQNIPYVSGQKVALFTFENGGNCSGNPIFLMENDTDPFFPPNSQSANVGQQITVSGFGSAGTPVCVINNQPPDCDGVAPSPTTETISSTITLFEENTICLTDVLQLPNGIGSASVCNSSIFVDINPVDNYDCIYITASENFHQSELICVIHCDEIETGICDTTYIEICPELEVQNSSICEGESTSLNVSGGTGVFSWSPASGLSCTDCPEPIASPNVTTTYTLSTVDANSCSFSKSLTVDVIASPVVNFSAEDVCQGEALVFTNSTENPSSISNWIWNFGDNESTSSTLSPQHTYSGSGNYTVTLEATNNMGCGASTNKTISVFGTPNVQAGENTTLCSSESLTLQASGATTYSWSPATGLSATDISNPTADPDNSITYTLAGTDANGCSNQDQIIVTVAETPQIDQVSEIQPANCSEKGSITISASGNGGNLQYSINGGTDFQSNASFTDLEAGSYQVMVAYSDNSCAVEYEQIIELEGVSLPEIASVTAIDPVSCDANDGEIQINSNEPNIEYSIDGGASWVSSGTFTGLASGQYEATLRIAGTDCIREYGNNPIVLTSPLSPTVLTPVEDITSCEGNTYPLSISISEAISDYNINSEAISNPQVNGSTLTFEATPSVSTTYSVELRAVSGCIVSETFKVEVVDFNPQDELTINKASACAGGGAGSISLNISDSEQYSFNWNGPGNFISSQQEIQQLTPGTYFCTITQNSSQCSWEFSSEVEQSSGMADVSISNIQHATCDAANASFSLTIEVGNPPFILNIYKNDQPYIADYSFISTDTLISGFAPGMYDLYVSSGDCEDSVLFPIQNNAVIVDVEAEISQPSCEGNDGSISLSTYPEGASFEWTTSDNSVLPNSHLVENLKGGNYTVTVTTAAGCQNSFSYTLNEAILPTLEITSVIDVVCVGDASGSVLFSLGGSGAYQYTLSNGLSGSLNTGTEYTFNDLSSDVYTMTIFNQDNNCEVEESFTISEPTTPLKVMSNVENATECGLSNAIICLQFTGGEGPYFIQTSQGNAPSEVAANEQACVENLYAGIVNIIITDALGCVVTAEETLFPPVVPEIQTSDIIVEPIECPGSESYSSILSSTEQVYKVMDSLNNVIGFTPVQNLLAGQYVVSLGEGECEAKLEVEITQAEAWDITVESTAESCTGQDGSISININNPNGTYSYTWQTGGSSENVLTGVSSNETFTVSITDENGCETILENLSVELDCDIFPCEPVFTGDSLSITIQGEETEVCLPINIADVSSYDFLLNSTAIVPEFGDCSGAGEQSIFIERNQEYNVLILSNPETNCKDTLIIRILLEEVINLSTDTLYLKTVFNTPIEDICLDNSELPGTVTGIHQCNEPQNGIIQSSDFECLSYTPNAEFIGLDEFCVILCDDQGYCDTTHIFVEIQNRELIIFSGFSPNNDGINDVFTIKNIEYYPDNEAIIFNRWGSRVFYGKGYTNDKGWEGGFDGQTLPSGTYFYILKDGEGTEYSGYLQISP
ncbi:MAG: T9SS type B sorting domain-containing protein, partial [Bacteroidetes bacterium]|nr:T9SS type B sorting domain-containing protein [Bacteroidota bacterium]